MTILVCDTGGTHIRFALSGDGKTLGEPQKLKILDYPDFWAALEHFLFLEKCPADQITSFRLSYGEQNPWKEIGKETANFLPKASFLKLNDFEANSYGILGATDDNFLELNIPSGSCSNGASRCVIGSGTGLGLAYICATKNGSYIQRTHGGHMLPSAFRPEHKEMFDAVQKFKTTPSAIIYEDILSGPGIMNVYKILSGKSHTFADEYRDTNDLIARGRNNPLVKETLRLYHEILGIFAHQAVAFGCAYRGLYLTGGITDRLMSNNLFDGDTFGKYFKQSNVAVVRKDVDATPILWVKDEFIALKGLLEIKA